LHYPVHLAKDNKLKKLIEGRDPFSLEKREDVHHYLCASIMSQQLSTKVADTIHKRFLAIYEGRVPSPEEILSTPFEVLRAIGLSNAKVNYVHNVARFAIEPGMSLPLLDEMDNEAVIGYLTQIKGVGRWTAEMLLMFCLGREDVFAVDDLGIQNAMIHLYKLDRTDKRSFRGDMLRIAGEWSPYRTYACLHLWHWKDNSPVPAAKAKAGATKKSAAGLKGSSNKKSAARAKGGSGKKRVAPKKSAARKSGTSKKSSVRSKEVVDKGAARPSPTGKSKSISQKPANSRG
jgi:DNA-3-methyladenine glycosylase II